MLQAYSVGVIALLSAMSPGPDFLILSKYALCETRRQAIFCALGIALGILVHVSYCVLGLAFIITRSIVLFNLIKLAGAAYLIYLGLQGLKSKKDDRALKQQKDSCQNNDNNKPQPSVIDALKTGFYINVLNPKCSLFMLSVFTLLIDPHTSPLLQVAFGLEISLIALTWFCLLALGISLAPIKRRFANFQHWISRLTGAVLIALGLKIAFEKS